jgi:hypothetical protein
MQKNNGHSFQNKLESRINNSRNLIFHIMLVIWLENSMDWIMEMCMSYCEECKLIAILIK